MGRERFFAHNPRLAIVPAGGGTPRSISERFDEIPSVVEWTPAGIYFTALQKTASHLFRLDPDQRRVHTRLGARRSDGRLVLAVARRPPGRVHRRVTAIASRAVRVGHAAVRASGADAI